MMDPAPREKALPRPASAFSPPPEQAGSGEELHELRVRIPVDLHRQLLSLKILRGKSLADTVALALDLYFAQRRDLAKAEQDEAETRA